MTEWSYLNLGIHISYGCNEMPLSEVFVGVFLRHAIYTFSLQSIHHFMSIYTSSLDIRTISYRHKILFTACVFVSYRDIFILEEIK